MQTESFIEIWWLICKIFHFLSNHPVVHSQSYCDIHLLKSPWIKPPFNVEKLKGHRNSNLTSKWFWSSSDLVSRTRGAAKKSANVHVHCIIIKHCRPWVKMLLIYNNGSIYCSRTYFIFCCKITAFFLQVFFYRNLFLFSSVLYIKMHYII